MNTKGTLSNVSWTFSSNIIYAFTQFLTLSIIAKLGGPYEVGIFTLALSIVSPIFLFLNLRLKTVIITDAEKEYYSWDYIHLRSITGTIAISLIVCIVLIANYNVYTSLIILILSIAKFFEMKTDLLYGFLQKKSLFNITSKSVIGRGILNVLMMITLYYYSGNILLGIIGLAISNIIMYLFYDKRNIEKFTTIYREKTSLEIDKLRSLFLLALPLGLSTVIGSLNTNVPRYIIENKLGLYELGIFAGISYLLVIGNTLLNAVSQVYMPKLSKYVKNNMYDQFIFLIKKMVLIGIVLSAATFLIFYFAGEQILIIMYSKEYAEYNNILMILVLGMSLLYSSIFLGTALTALKEFKIQPYIHLSSLLSVILASFLLIEDFQLVGMAWAVVIGYFVTSIAYLLIIKKVIKRRLVKDGINIKATK